MKATEDDLLVIKYIAPRDLEDFEKIDVILMEEIKTKDRILRELREIEANVKNFERLVESAREFDTRLIEYSKNLRRARSRIEVLTRNVEDEEIKNLAEQLIDNIERVLLLINYKLNL